MSDFNLSLVFDTVATTVPDQPLITWRGRDHTYAEVNARAQGLAHFLHEAGLGCHTERTDSGDLAGHLSGQDHLGLYLRNGPEYLEGMIGAYRARLAPFNVNFRYVDEELAYLLADAQATALIYHAEFAAQVAAVRDQLPHLKVLIQVADDSGNELLPGAVAYETAASHPAPEADMPVPTGDDLFILYTGGTTGMPKGVLWRQDDMYVSSMGGTPWGSTDPFASYDAIAEAAAASPGSMSLLMIPPFMHAAAQWAAFHIITNGGRIVLPDDVRSMNADDVVALAAKEKVLSIPTVGDAVALPLVEAIERGDHDLSSLGAINNGAAALSPGVRERFLKALPGIMVLDAVGASETGVQMKQLSAGGNEAEIGVFDPDPDTTVVSEDRTRVVPASGGSGWLARSRRVPLGYLGDEAKTAETFPVIDGTRWSVPGDRAEQLADGRIRLLGRDSVTVNSGGEKIFVEEVERALAHHPAVRDVVVTGRPSERWGSEVVTVVQIEEGREQVTDAELLAECALHIARYKLPKAILREPFIQRNPAGKADYRWARAVATAEEESS